MIIKLLMFIMFWPVVAIAECDTSIQLSDTIGSVKEKINCLATENAGLKKELQSKKETYTPMRITWGSSTCDPQPSAAECVSRAISILQKRDWHLVAQSTKVAELTNKNNTIVVDCSFHQIVVSGPVRTELNDISKLFNKIIFDDQ